MLMEPTINKMLAMKLNGMTEALEEQRKSADATAWNFEDRLALLVERQWLWKENRALATRLKFAKLPSRPAWRTSTIGTPAGCSAA